MLILQSIAYRLPAGEFLFNDLSFTVNRHDKLSLTGNNGAGKSTLLRIMAGLLSPTTGSVIRSEQPYYVPQHFGQYDNLSIAGALRIEAKLTALHAILDADVTDENFLLLDDDWGIEERCAEALTHWGLQHLPLNASMSRLSGGEKTKVFLAGIAIHQPGLVLLDEPSNHLDTAGRQLLYDYLQKTTDTLVVVSHDRRLLNLMDSVAELSDGSIALYGGNYDFFAAQKSLEQQARQQEVKEGEKALRKARETERETAARQQKLDARGKRKQEKSGLPTISMNTLRNQAEKSTARSKDAHSEKTTTLSDELNRLRKAMPERDKMKIGFDDPALHHGKVLIRAVNVSFELEGLPLWNEPLSFEIRSGERLVIRGRNGSGKTTLLQMLLGQLHPMAGTFERMTDRISQIDQEYSLPDERFSVYEHAQTFNSANLEEHEVKRRLDHFLFGKEDWNKPCTGLSGGERLRLLLCSLTLAKDPPDMLLLDEPTNNLDLQNITMLTEAIRDYAGTLIVVSHDEWFLRELGMERELILGAPGPE